MYILQDILTELEKAEKKHAPMNNAHEAYAVILEELDEFWEEVRAQVFDKKKARKELIQIAAMALRAIKNLKLESEV